MDLYIGERGSGKTSKLIKLSHKLNYPIICKSGLHQKAIKNKSKDMGVDTPTIFTLSDIKDYEYRGYHYKGYCIDNLGDVINKLLGINVCVGTMTINEIHEEKKNNNDGRTITILNK